MNNKQELTEKKPKGLNYESIKGANFDVDHKRENKDLFQDELANISDYEALLEAGDLYIKQFHRSNALHNIAMNGLKAIKNPVDLMMIQQMIYKLRPDNIIETGAGFLGSSFQYCIWMEMFSLKGKVYAIEMLRYQSTLVNNNDPWNNQITKDILNNRLQLLSGHYSIAYTVKEILDREVLGKNNLVILDSDHESSYVYMEMNKMKEYVLPGGYMIVEDTCLGADLGIRDKYPEWWRGPWHAVERFLKENDNWVMDRTCEYFGCTSNPGGFLRRVS